MRDARLVRWLELVIVAAVCAFTFFYGLAHFGLVGADEPRYAQIAREMLERHDWITPTLYGKLWLEKPVLYYWSAMVSYKIFGVSDWAARFPTAVFATAMVFTVYTFARRFRPGAALNAALITATCAGVIGFSRAASTDMPLTTTLASALLAWTAWQQRGEKRWLAMAYMMLSLATLAKGPIAPALAAGIVVVFAAARRDWRIIVRSLWAPGIVLFLAVMLPWYLAVEHSTHRFFSEFIIKHNLARYQTNLFQHHQPFWYYLIVLPVALLPWTTFAIAGFARAVRERADDVRLLLAIWATLPVVFFSFSGSKLPGYILPALPAWALLAAWYLDEVHESGVRMRLAVPHSAMLGAVFGAALLSSFVILKLRPGAAAWTIGIIGSVAVFAVALLAVASNGVRAVRLATLVPLLVALAFVLRFVAPSIDAKQSARPVAQALGRLRTATPVVAYHLRRDLVYGLSFYRNQPVLYPAANAQPAADFVYANSLPANEFIFVLGPESRGLELAPGRLVMAAGGYVPQRLRFIYVARSDTGR